MDGDGVRAIITAGQEAYDAKIVEIAGVPYTTKPVHDVRERAPEATNLNVFTLSGFVDFAKSVVSTERAGGGADAPTFLAHVTGPTSVVLFAEKLSGYFRQREAFVNAGHKPEVFTFGRFMDSESFNVALQTLFVDTEERARLLKLVGNLQCEKVRQTTDDGISQTVVAKMSVAALEAVAAPNPITLTPRRTFTEIDQPSSPFVFRLKGGGPDAAPNAALFEADGGAWQLVAIQRIAAYLRKELDGQPIKVVA